MIRKTYQSIKSNTLVNNLRNYFLIKPSIYLKPKSEDISVSDFFFWKCDYDFETKFFITNLASQILPDIKQDDKIKIMIFENDGNLFETKDFILKPFETREFIFDDIRYQNKYGSFFVFHQFEKLDDLINNGCHIAERGYTGYKKKMVFGILSMAIITLQLLLSNGYIQSLISTSFFKSSYRMQVSFKDCNKQQLIINNPDQKILNYDLSYFDKNNNFLKRDIIKLKPKETKLYDLDNEDLNFIEIKSNFIFCRPLVLKYYDSYFDIFHA